MTRRAAVRSCSSCSRTRTTSGRRGRLLGDVARGDARTAHVRQPVRRRGPHPGLTASAPAGSAPDDRAATCSGLPYPRGDRARTGEGEDRRVRSRAPARRRGAGRALTRRLELGFVAAATRHADLPPTAREVALVGRSNVGKSSLINALAGRSDLARVSATPGHTRLLTLFAAPSGGGLVDLPGYGFARVPRGERAGWQEMIEAYLLERDELELVLVLVDAAIGPSRTDAQMLDWLRANEVPFAIVAMKADNVRPSATVRRKREVAIGCGLEPGDVSWVSATKGTGVDQLRQHLASFWLGT